MQQLLQMLPAFLAFQPAPWQLPSKNSPRTRPNVDFPALSIFLVQGPGSVLL
jgi:hypothetical protein